MTLRKKIVLMSLAVGVFVAGADMLRLAETPHTLNAGKSQPLQAEVSLAPTLLAANAESGSQQSLPNFYDQLAQASAQPHTAPAATAQTAAHAPDPYEAAVAAQLGGAQQVSPAPAVAGDPYEALAAKMLQRQQGSAAPQQAPAQASNFFDQFDPQAPQSKNYFIDKYGPPFNPQPQVQAPQSANISEQMAANDPELKHQSTLQAVAKPSPAQPAAQPQQGDIFDHMAANDPQLGGQQQAKPNYEAMAAQVLQRQQVAAMAQPQSPTYATAHSSLSPEWYASGRDGDHTIRKVAANGQFLLLSDGSVWKSQDRSESRGWSSGDRVYVHSYTIIDLDQNAQKIDASCKERGCYFIGESNVTGNFEGSSKPIVLDNGMIFEATTYSYHYAYHPEALILASKYGGGIMYCLLIDGEIYNAKRIR